MLHERGLRLFAEPETVLGDGRLCSELWSAEGCRVWHKGWTASPTRRLGCSELFQKCPCRADTCTKFYTHAPGNRRRRQSPNRNVRYADWPTHIATRETVRRLPNKNWTVRKITDGSRGS